MSTPATPVFGVGNTGTGTGAVVVTLPTHQTGDLLIVQIDQNSNATFSGITTGWLALRAAQSSSTVLTQSLYYKIAASGAETNPSFTPSKTITWSACSMRFRDVDVVQNVGNPNTGVGGTAATTHTFGTLAALDQPNCIHVITLGKLAGTNETDAQLTPPTNYTEGYPGGQITNGTTIKSWAAYRNLVGPGSLTVGSATGTVSVRWVSQSFILRSTEYATYRSTGAGVGAVGTTGPVTPNLPAGAATGDLLMVQVYVEPSTATVATPTNYTARGNQIGTSARLYVFSRTHTAGDTSPTITPTGSTIIRSIIDAYYRPNATTPIDGSVFSDAGSTSAPATGSFTTVATNVTGYALFSVASSTVGISTPPSTWYERHDTTGEISQDQIVVSSGSSVSSSATLSVTAQTITAVLGIRSTTSVAGAIFNVTVSATQATAVALVRQGVLTLSVPQTQAVTLLRTANLIVKATQAQAVTVLRALAKTINVTQAQAVTNLVKAVLTLTATQAQSVSVTTQKAVGVIVSATQAQAVTLRRTAGLIVTATQGAVVTLMRQTRLFLKAMQAQAVTVTASFLPAAGNVFHVTVTALQATAVTLRRLTAVVVTVRIGSVVTAGGRDLILVGTRLAKRLTDLLYEPL